MKDRRKLLISQSQILSFIAFHLIRYWPYPCPPNMDQILNSWIGFTKIDFDSFDQYEIEAHELKSYLEITLNHEQCFRMFKQVPDFDLNGFLDSVVKSIEEELAEIKEP